MSSVGTIKRQLHKCGTRKKQKHSGNSGGDYLGPAWSISWVVSNMTPNLFSEKQREETMSRRHRQSISLYQMLKYCDRILHTVHVERKPGIYQDIMDAFGHGLKGQSSCLTFDGKKLKQGLTPESGDVDLLGFEKCRTLDQRQLELHDSLNEINAIIEQLEPLDPAFEASTLTPLPRKYVVEVCRTELKAISECIHQVKEIKRKKEYCKQKLIERGGDTNWRKGKYVYAISAIIAFIYDINEVIEKAKRTLDDICRCLSYYNNSNYALGDTMNLDENPSFVRLDADNAGINTRLIQQRSEQWFDLRRQAKVTGSTLYKALGFDGLSAMKEHFENVVCGVPVREPSPETKSAMQHGTDNEPNAIATLVGKVLPVICPDVTFYEEGFVEIQDTEGKTFMVVSPDGSLGNSQQVNVTTTTTVAAIEVKCPIRGVHTKFPERYVLQCLSEIEALNVEYLLYLSWTKEESTVFRVKRNSTLFQHATNIALDMYGGINPKKPMKVKDEAKKMKDMIRDECSAVEFVGQFTSLTHQMCKNSFAANTMSIGHLIELFQSIQNVKSSFYEVNREKASEAMVFLSADLDRSYLNEKVRCAPVCWFPKGYSLNTETLRNISESVHTECHESGIHIPCQSFDGQWHNLVVRSKKNEPLTILQAQKDVWKEVEQMRKATIVCELRKLNRNPQWYWLTKESQNTDGNPKVIHATNDDVRLPHIKKMVKMYDTRGTEIAPVDNSVEQVTLADAIPTHIVEEINAQDKMPILAMATIEEHQEREAFSCNVNEETWVSVLTGEDRMDETVTYIAEMTEENDEEDIDTVAKRNVSRTSNIDETVTNTAEMIEQNDEEDIYTVAERGLSWKCNIDETATCTYNTEEIDEDDIDTVAEESVSRKSKNPITHESNDMSPDQNITNRSTKQRAANGKGEQPSIKTNNLNENDATYILAMLRSDQSSNKDGRWNNKSEIAVLDYMSSVTNVRSLRDVDLKIFIRYLKRTKGLKCKESVSKESKIKLLYDSLLMDGAITKETIHKKKKQPIRSLSDCATKMLTKSYSKQDLNVTYAEYIWPDRYNAWLRESPLIGCPKINSTDEPDYWFYKPEYSNTRDQLEVKCIDSTHLFTRTRRKSCKGGLDGISNKPWMIVANTRKTFLSTIMVEEVTDPMSVTMASTHFSEAVENEMRLQGNFSAAELCKDIRQWWESEDEAGIPSSDRIVMRTKLRKRLLDKVKFDKFPPPTVSVGGWPLQLWEALVSNIDAKALLYSLCRSGTYNVRAFSSMAGETFFSELVLHDKRGHGTVTSSEFGQFIGATIEQIQIRLDPERTFSYRTARSHAYKILDNDECAGDNLHEDHNSLTLAEDTNNKEINRISTRDHIFDKKERRTKCRQKKYGTVSSDRNAVQKGTLGVRWETARRNDSKMLPTKKMGLKENDVC